MTFWNGTAWVADPATTPSTPARRPGRRLRLPFLAIAIGLMLVLPTLAWGRFASSDDQDLASAGPTVTVTGVGSPGQLVVIDGRGFRPHQVYQVRWDSMPRAIRLVWPSVKGTFHGHLRIPAGVADGTHTATFAPVNRQAAIRVANGTLKLSAVTGAAPILRVHVRVHRSGAGKNGSGGSGGSGTLTFDAECGGSSLDPLFHAVPWWVAGWGLDSDFMGDLRQVSVGGGLLATSEDHARPAPRRLGRSPRRRAKWTVGAVSMLATPTCSVSMIEGGEMP